MKSCLLLLGSLAGGIGIGIGVASVMRSFTGDDDLSSTIGTGVWLLSFPIIHLYASLWFINPEEIANRVKPQTTIQKWRANKAESKLQAAELRIGLICGAIGGVTAAMVSDSKLVIAVITICCATAGGLVGFDVKRRVRRIRELRCVVGDPSDSGPVDG